MTGRTRLLLLVTHLAAVGLGAAIALSGSGGNGYLTAEAAKGPRPAKSDARRGQRTRRVATEELWDAYARGSQRSDAQMARRAFFGDLPTPEVQASFEDKDKYAKTPKQRAAEVIDFVAAMDAGVRAVNGGPPGDGYRFYEALLERWVNEDPEAAMAWMGRMESKTIWQDAFDGIMAGNLKDDPVRFFELMERDWLPRNRDPLFERLAAYTGEHNAERLPEVLAYFADSRQRGNFLRRAAKGAHAGNIGTWLEVLAGEQSSGLAEVVATSAFRDIGRDWEERTQAILAEAEGTAFEEILRSYWERRSFMKR